MTDLSIIIVTYKENLDILKACFDSVASSTGVTYELIVVDNGQNSATQGLLKSYPGARYIRNPDNLGFAAAVNIGMRQRKGRHVLLLNPDTSFAPDVLQRMVRHLDEDTNVGIASSVIRYPNGDLQESIRRFPTLKDQLLILLKVPHFLRTRAVDRYMMKDIDPLKTQDVNSIMGAFMFIREAVLQQIGLFDERYFIWFEEVDYCKMAHDAGWKIRHYGDVVITHHKGHMFSKLATIRKQQWIRESLRKYMKKHHGVFPWLLLWAMSAPFVGLAYLVSFVKPK